MEDFEVEEERESAAPSPVKCADVKAFTCEVTCALTLASACAATVIPDGGNLT